MHKEIFSTNQLDLLPLVKQFKREFYLVNGTAIALHIGHRRSIDFDLFKKSKINPSKILSKIEPFSFPTAVTRRVSEQLNITIHNVKFTFFEYPFDIEAELSFEDSIWLPELIDLAAMKAYALGRRSKWKDYVDLYFIIKNYFSIKQISEKASLIYDQLFSEKLFRAQLSYFADINYSEPVEYIGKEIPEEEIKNFLIEKAIDLDL
jgi:hypothetical protein